MTTDELRIAVAESLGWKRDQEFNNIWFRHPSGNLTSIDALPNYPTSLDACREFEKDLEGEALDDYCHNLYTDKYEILEDGIKISTDLYEEHGMHGLIHATAEQRCRAWLAFTKERK